MKVSRQSQIVRGIGPSGYRVRANVHRVYRTPSGAFTPNPVVASNVEAKFVRRRFPATYSPQRPRNVGADQGWVQLSRGDAQLGVLHRPGLAPRNVTVLTAQQTGNGAIALVRYAIGGPQGNPSRWRRRQQTISAACRWDHHKQKWVGPAGENCGDARSHGSGPYVVSTRVGGRRSSRPATALYNPNGEGFIARGAAAVRRTVRGLATGTKKIELDRRGVKIVPKSHVR